MFHIFRLLLGLALYSLPAFSNAQEKFIASYAGFAGISGASLGCKGFWLSGKIWR